MSGVDLGAYHFRIILEDGRGWIMEWSTGARYTHGCNNCHPLDAKRINPIYASEENLFSSVLFQFLENNYSCDCNKSLFLADSMQTERPDETQCADTMTIKSIDAIKPDGTEVQIYHVAEESA